MVGERGEQKWADLLFPRSTLRKKRVVRSVYQFHIKVRMAASPHTRIDRNYRLAKRKESVSVGVNTVEELKKGPYVSKKQVGTITEFLALQIQERMVTTNKKKRMRG